MHREIDIRWLIDPSVGGNDGMAGPASAAVHRLDYPFPAEIGQGWFEYLVLAEGARVFKATHRFLPEAAGNLVLTGEIQSSFAELTFHAATIRGGICHRHERFPAAELILKPGVDFFRHADRFHVRQMIDASSDSEVSGFALTDTLLAELLGDELADRLLTGLGLNPAPVVKMAAMPPHVSAPLCAIMSPAFSGPLKRLFAQSKLLEYLCILAAHVATEPQTIPCQVRWRNAVRQLHDDLMRLEGKLPTLEQLAMRYGMPVKSLNDRFAQEYGQSIYTFITEHRLREAHLALQESHVPMKVLAERIGFSHVNNFINAFRKKFGYPPGKLRQRKPR
ncbi:MAG: helix-turn-helix transcriptional regulator [Sulfuricella sp.]|nr:helix-turn-helix transcriptional regulator [Sulfuricella sp.]